MSKKDYERTAAILRKEITTRAYEEHAFKAAKRIAEDMAEMFEAENSRFDRKKFLKACGL